MSNRLWTLPSVSFLFFALAAQPAPAAEARSSNFSLMCDATTRNVLINQTGLGTSTNRFIQSAAIAMTQPRDGIKFMRLQAAPGDITKTLLVMGFHEISKEMVYISSLVPVSTNASGNVTIQVQGSCTGGGSAQGIVTIHYFS